MHPSRRPYFEYSSWSINKCVLTVPASEGAGRQGTLSALSSREDAYVARKLPGRFSLAWLEILSQRDRSH